MLAGLVLALVAAAGCSGTLDDGDGGCAGGQCPADADADGTAVDPCDTIQCPAGQSCVEGRCRTADLCGGVVCPNPGEVCDPRDGSCQSGAADDDGDGVTIAAGDCDDGDASIRPGATEACDGVDQDCDREVDDGFADADGDGFDVCGFGSPAQADCDDADGSAHPGGHEECDGDDDDCDGAVDEGLDPRPCATVCGDGEERCEGGAWSACSAAEACDCAPAGTEETEACGACGSRAHTCQDDLTWSDWGACEGESVCSPGSLDFQTCGNCGRQERTCTAACAWPADWGPCAGEGECAATTTGPCTTSCGSAGWRSCGADCRWGACAAPGETCNGADDDCDGEVDDGYRALDVGTTYSTLVTLHPACDGSTQRWGLNCSSAFHRFCASRGCTNTGFGPVENDGDTAGATCVVAEIVGTTWSELSARHPACDGATELYGPSCNAAISRFCSDRGRVSGFGPVEVGDTGDVSVACVASAEYVVTAYSSLAGHHPGCDGVTDRWTQQCLAAIHRFCQARGAVGGFGPVENSGDEAHVVCVRP